MQNIIFINQKTYKDSLVGPQLLSILPSAVYLDSKWNCYTNQSEDDDIITSVAMDNLIYSLNNFVLSNKFENIIIGFNPNGQLIDSVISHLDIDPTYYLWVFNLTETKTVVEDIELINKEYESNYYYIGKLLVKTSSIDTTDISAFKIAKILETIIIK